MDSVPCAELWRINLQRMPEVLATPGHLTPGGIFFIVNVASRDNALEEAITLSPEENVMVYTPRQGIHIVIHTACSSNGLLPIGTTWQGFLLWGHVGM